MDSQGLYNKADHPGAVAWSEEGLLAAAGATTVTLLRPGCLDGPRSYVQLGESCVPDVIAAPGTAARPNIHSELAALRCLAWGSGSNASVGLTARGVAWSPLGAAPAAGCLLAAVTNDHRVRAAAGRRAGATSRQLHSGSLTPTFEAV